MVFPDKSRRYVDESSFITIGVREFVRRFRAGVYADDLDYSWLLGAGCSVSSGVPNAADAAKAWLADLRFLEDGEEGDVDAWASKRFVGYEPADPGGVYGQVLDALFHTPHAKRRAINKLTRAAQPGFGYATLTQLMTHPSWGKRCSFALTTNYDNLMQEALHIFGRARPRVVSHEAVTSLSSFEPDQPTVVRLAGDAHMPREAGGAPRFREVVRDRLREQIAHGCLIIVGYGGRDHAVTDLLNGLPVGAPVGGLYWINDAPPTGPFADLLRERGAVWVQHHDFDELMYFVRLEFGLGHPPVDRFRSVMLNYRTTYRNLATQAGLQILDGPSSLPRSDAQLAEFDDLHGGGARRTTRATQRDKLRQSLKAYATALAKTAGEASIDGSATERPRATLTAIGWGDAPAEIDSPEGAGGDGDVFAKAASELHGGFGAALMGDGPVARRSLEPIESRERNGDAGAIEDAQEPVQLDTLVGGGAAEPAGEMESTVDEVLAQLERDSEMEIPSQERSDGAARAEAVRAAISKTAGDDASPLKKIGAQLVDRDRSAVRRARGARSPELLAADEAKLRTALHADPGDASARVTYARFLAEELGDAARAEAEFETAQQMAPDDVPTLRAYARFAMEQLRNLRRADRLLTRALNLDLRNAETLRLSAEYLLRAKGDLAEAEGCLKLAVGMAPANVGARIDHARFLADRRGDFDAAEAELRRAASATPPDPSALAELSLFFIERRRDLDAAARPLAEAGRIAPGSALVSFVAARLAEEKGDLDAAEAAFSDALRADPRGPRARLAFAEFLWRRRSEIDAAEATLDAALADAPHNASLLVAAARFALEARGDRPRSDALLRKAVEAEANDPIVLAALATQMARDPNMVDDADALFSSALELSPKNAAILRDYGRFLADVRNDPDEAEARLKEAVLLDPYDAEAREALAQFLHLVRSDVVGATAAFREAVQMSPDRTRTLARFAAFLRDTNQDPAEAERLYRKAVERNPNDARTLARCAQFLLSEGRIDEGLTVLQDCFDAAWRIDGADRPKPMMLEIWIYRYAFDPERSDEPLTAALTLIETGARTPGVEYGGIVDAAIRTGRADAETLTMLVDVAANGRDPSALISRLRPARAI